MSALETVTETLRLAVRTLVARRAPDAATSSAEVLRARSMSSALAA